MYYRRSQIATLPALYSPSGIVPLRTVFDCVILDIDSNRFVPGVSGGPFGTADDFRTPSISRRKSKWCLDAQCSWTTNVGKTRNATTLCSDRSVLSFVAKFSVAFNSSHLDHSRWPAMSEEYTVCRCGAKFTNDAEGKRLYELHQSWCGRQGAQRSEESNPSRAKRR